MQKRDIEGDYRRERERLSQFARRREQAAQQSAPETTEKEPAPESAAEPKPRRRGTSSTD